MKRIIRLTALLCCVALAALPARADELQDISRLLRQGQQAQAMERVNQYLAQKPRDAQARFLKGLIFTEQNKITEAIDVFSKLSQDYPELPEPYNNLAVLYAAQGQYEKARQPLEMSIRTHPSYATAYENLGDVYAKLASQAYDKALQLDSSNSAAQNKLSMIRELITNSSRPPRTLHTAEPARVADASKAAEPPVRPAAGARRGAEVPGRSNKPAPEEAKAPARAVGARTATMWLKAVRSWARA